MSGRQEKTGADADENLRINLFWPWNIYFALLETGIRVWNDNWTQILNKVIADILPLVVITASPLSKCAFRMQYCFLQILQKNLLFLLSRRLISQLFSCYIAVHLFPVFSWRKILIEKHKSICVCRKESLENRGPSRERFRYQWQIVDTITLIKDTLVSNWTNDMKLRLVLQWIDDIEDNLMTRWTSDIMTSRTELVWSVSLARARLWSPEHRQCCRILVWRLCDVSVCVTGFLFVRFLWCASCVTRGFCDVVLPRECCAVWFVSLEVFVT